MPALKTTGLAAMICAGFLLTGTAWSQTASENAVQAAMDACQTEKEDMDSKMHCQLHVMAMQQSMHADAEGLEGMFHFDFDDSNDSEAQKAAKQAMYSALNDCEQSGDPADQIANCRMEAMHQYQEAIGQ